MKTIIARFQSTLYYCLEEKIDTIIEYDFFLGGGDPNGATNFQIWVLHMFNKYALSSYYRYTFFILKKKESNLKMCGCMTQHKKPSFLKQVASYKIKHLGIYIAYAYQLHERTTSTTHRLGASLARVTQWIQEILASYRF